MPHRGIAVAATLAAAVGAAVVTLQVTAPLRTGTRTVASDALLLTAPESAIAAPAAPAGVPLADGATRGEVGRAIAQTVSLTIRADDVRGAFLHASRLASAAHGEHVEASTLTGEGTGSHGSVTLRVRPDRLDATLNALRELGRVADEKRSSDDLTADLVDLEAQLRNERAIEAELLELLKSRGDAPLDEILKLRASLSQVRGSIERLDGRRSAIDRLVGLATVVVVIRPEVPDGPPPAEPASMSEQFRSGIAAAFRDGMTALAGSCAFLVRAAIGGLPWWLALAALLPLALRGIRGAARLSTDGA